jgi:putative NIF3 family GTP cyclohydrolase 1 type 2
MGIAYIAAGHHATERYGISALGNHLRDKLGIDHDFVEIYNPI